MSRYCIKSDYVKAAKKTLQKLGKVRIVTKDLDGYFTIVGLRKYNHSVEVDVEFTGTATFMINRKREVCESSMLKRPRVSKVRVNRILRKYLAKDVQIRVNYFDMDFRFYNDIKKITWK